MALPSCKEAPTIRAGQAARLLDVSEKHLRDEFHRGNVPGCMVGRAIRLNRRAVYAMAGLDENGELAGASGGLSEVTGRVRAAARELERRECGNGDEEEISEGERRIPALAAKARGAIAEAFYAVCDLRDEIQGDERFCNADGSDCWELWGYALSGINDARLHAEEAADTMGCPDVDLGPDLFGGTDGHEV